MEANILAEEFQKSKAIYGIIYNKIVADSDISCYDAILERHSCRPHNITVKKLECRNHLLRNYIKKIRKLTKNCWSHKTHKNISVKRKL